MKKKQKRHINPLAWIALFIYTVVSVFLVEMNFTTFQTSVIPTQNAPAFDGTIAPIKKAPNWVALTTEEFKMTYNELEQRGKLVSFPNYNPANLKISVNSLTWGNKAHDAIRNEKITFSVPYMGNYKLDGVEYGGGHLAVDIKTPTGTPVYAIGNGIVKKTSEQLYGFGKHVVIEHKNFPSIDNQSQKTNYYSSYSHLSSVSASEGSIVRKGDLIGYSGSTGTSTTPHLHFQIDKSSTPWQPYWHFTSKEAADAGYNFTTAINAGFKKEDAIQNTINPMAYVQKYASGSVVSSDTSTSTSTSTSTNTTTTETTSTSTTTTSTNTSTSGTINAINNTDSNSSTNTTSSTNSTSSSVSTDTTDTSDDEPLTEDFVTFEIDSRSTFEAGQDFEIKIKAVTRTGEVVTNYNPTSPVRIELMQGSATINPSRLGKADFINGIATITISPRSESPIQFMIKTDTVMKESQVFAKGLFVDVSVVHPHFEAISFLKNEGVIQGYPDGSFKPKNSVSRVEVLKFILEGTGAEIANTRSLPFSDTENETWYSDYLQTAIYLGIVQGYPDGTFKPERTVNKAEFLKMLVEAMDIEISEEIGYMPFTDVKKDHWYAPYVQFAYQKNIIETSGKLFNPQEEMTRENVAEAMYRVKVLKQTGAAQFAKAA